MSSPAQHALRPLGRTVSGAGGAALPGALAHPLRPALPGGRPSLGAADPGGATRAVALRVGCSREGFARARTFTHDTLRCWSLGHRSDDAVLVITELAANAVEHAVPRATASHPDVWLGLVLDPAHLTLTVSDPSDDLPERAPGDDLGLREYGRGLCIVDALAEEWGWTPTPPAGKTVWARLSTCPPP